MEQSTPGGDLNVLDGIALVMGSAIASAHILRVIRSDLTAAGWLLVWLTFVWVAVTASGPFIFLARRYSRHLPGYPQIGDLLWTLLGLPWLLTAVIQSAVPASEPGQNPLFVGALSLGLAIACIIALVILWRTWVMVPAEQAARLEAAPWTNRVGLILAIAWPVQCGLGMVILS
ncbi:MAG: hypothetical protein U0790_05595 [Isosphaeraceae bacterium]